MRCGMITCKCKQQFYFETENDTIACIKCKTIYDTTSYPLKVEEGELDGTELRDSEEL